MNITIALSITDLINQVEDLNKELQKRSDKIVHLNQEKSKSQSRERTHDSHAEAEKRKNGKPIPR
jgi:hypothetical protein